jgi:hypothetical protein
MRAACNLHTAVALVSKMKALGIRASSTQLVMRPEAELQRRKRHQAKKQACASAPLSSSRGAACANPCMPPCMLLALHATGRACCGVCGNQ